MRLPTFVSIGLAALGAAALSGPTLAHDRHEPGDTMPPMGMDHMDHGEMPPPVYHGPDGPMPRRAYNRPYGNWQHPGGPMPGPWMPPCAEQAEPAGCGPYAHGYPAYPMMTYAVPMMMVPVLRQKPCPEEVVEEWVEEEPAPVRRRYIPPPPVKDKRVKIAPVPDKRVPMTPDKRVPDKRIPY